MPIQIKGIRRIHRLSCLLLFYAVVSLSGVTARAAQRTGNLRGTVVDPSGAVVPDTIVRLARNGKSLTVHSTADGAYAFHAVRPGIYTLTIEAKGFADFSQRGVMILPGRSEREDVSLKIAVQRQKVTIAGRSPGLSVNPNRNASALVFTGSALNAFSSNPQMLQEELQALAGPAAGPGGGEIYVDGFAGDQIPPKSSIREIRINQNPFSAEHAALGYGRIEILTKPGSSKFSGGIFSTFDNSAFDTGNPLIPERPVYYTYNAGGNASGPLSKNASYFMGGYWFQTSAKRIVDAVNPDDTDSKVLLAYPLLAHTIVLDPRLDVQLGKDNTLSVRDFFYRKFQGGSGVGGLTLPAQAYSTENEENDFQAANTTVINSHLLTETRFQWRRLRSVQAPRMFTPTVTVVGAFTNGGNNSGTVEDHQDDFELQSDWIATWGRHTIHFGGRARVYRDANYSTSGANGNYIFYSTAQYNAKTPGQYQVTVVNHPLARAVLFDGALFYQDDWRVKPNFDLGYGLRLEGQNRIHNHFDVAPRVSIAWAPGRSHAAAKTVIRAGYGWYYDRFTVPSSFNATGSNTPFLMRAIHENGINQQSYVVNNPDFYDPNTTTHPVGSDSNNGAVPFYYTVDPHFHAALNMQAAVGVDQKLGKRVTANLTYLYTRGVHQYLTNNITAPGFDAATYAITGPTPSIYNYQFRSGGVYKQHELVATVSAQLHRLGLHAVYDLNFAKSDTEGVDYFPSVPQDPSLDYGRASFGWRNSAMLMGSYKFPYRVVFSTFFNARSGVPYNVTIGSDLTGNNQNNARPTYGVCGAPDVVSTKFGCLDTDPVGKGERMVPYGIGVGPANVALHVLITKAIGIGPREKSSTGVVRSGGGSDMSSRGLGSGQSAVALTAGAPRKYTLALAIMAQNALNIVNLGTPNGVLNSRLFGESQTLAGGQFGSWLPGNRTIMFAANLDF